MIPRLHLVTDDRVVSDPEFMQRARAAISRGGASVALHLRAPGLPARTLWNLGRELRFLTTRHETPFIVNDRLDVALVLGADGAHLGGRSLPVREAREVLGPDAILGSSVHGSGEARQLGSPRGEGAHAARRGPDFAFAGTLFATASHPDVTPGGLERVREIRRVLPSVPVIGIGGITESRVEGVLDAGGHGVAVVRAVWLAEDPAGATGALLEAIDRSIDRGNR